MGESELDKLLNSFIEKTETESDIFNKQVRFSISLPNFTQKRLEILCKKLNVTKQEFISKVIEASLTDLEERLELVSEAKADAFGNVSRTYEDSYEAELLQELGLGHLFSPSDKNKPKDIEPLTEETK